MKQLIIVSTCDSHNPRLLFIFNMCVNRENVGIKLFGLLLHLRMNS